jgi:membrane-associated phospholipid phosphatase
VIATLTAALAALPQRFADGAGVAGAWLAATAPWHLGALAIVAAMVIVATRRVDRPLAIRLRALDPRLHEAFKRLNKVGVSTGWLIGFAGGWVAATLGEAPLTAAGFGFLFLSVALGGIANAAGKFLFGRARPKLLFRDGVFRFGWLRGHADWTSFPSGHANTAAALTIGLALTMPWLAVFIGPPIAAIALGRVAVNAHYLGDVLAGAWLGATVTLMVAAGFGYL